MTFGSLVAIYFVVWWIVLFAVLPFGVRTQEEEGEVTLGTTHSAPVRPLLVRKAVVTTVIAAVIVGAFWIAVAHLGLDLELLARVFDMRQ
jgi:predicted secreted protein